MDTVEGIPTRETGEPLGAGMAEPVDHHAAFPRLTEPQRARLRAIGQVRTVETGELLYRRATRAMTCS